LSFPRGDLDPGHAGTVLHRRGLGEIGLGLTIGVIPVMATYFELTRAASWTAFLGGLIIGS